MLLIGMLTLQISNWMEKEIFMMSVLMMLKNIPLQPKQVSETNEVPRIW